MSFARPWLLLLLALPLLLAVWEWQRSGHRLVLPFDHGEVRHSAWLGRVVRSLHLAVPGLLAIAILLLAGPQRQSDSAEARVLTNLEFCLDVSGSMMSRFGDGQRADKAVEAIMEFTEFRKGDAFGLTAFGTEVLHWVPVTKDLAALRSSAPFLRPDKMPPYMGGTRIGHALRSVQKILTARPEGDRMIILISDGQSFDLGGGVAEKIGQELSADGIVMFYIHVAEGEPQDETFTIAHLTGGQAFAAGDPAALREVFRRIDAMKPARLKPTVPEPADFFGPFAIAGLGLLGLQMVSLLGLRYTPW
ncbi:MAG: Ca-activated chloride channel [Chthoniobacter sp.]|jgi:Ca-activated chloride channel family protein|nr:Ca-activated chloride channel [Chthoniobacter sp.]